MTLNCDRKPAIFEPYICKLTNWQKKFAEEEFREFDAIRGKWIDELRQWVIRNSAISWCRQDGLFLLRFLRYTKFARWCESPGLAQEALARYLAMRHIYPEWCQGLDPRGELMQKMVKDEVFTTLGTDSAGQMIVWIRLGRFDVDNLDSIVLLRYTIMFLELMAEQESVQIGGIKVWVDYKAATWKHFLRYNFDILRDFKRIIEKVMPIWIREVHNVGLPEIAGSFRTFVCDLGTDPLKYKTFWHTSSEDVLQYFEKANWPDEYGGRTNATRQAGYLKRLFEEKRDLLMELDRMDIDVGLEEIRFFKPKYDGQSKSTTQAKVKVEPPADIKCDCVKQESSFELTVIVKGEFGKKMTKENIQLTAEINKPEAKKKISKIKKKKSVKAKVDTNLKGKKAGAKKAAEMKNEKRASLPSEKLNEKKPWK